MRIYAAYNIKGGVGKTSAAVNLAYLATRAGRRTLVWDLDPQGAATYILQVRPRVKGGGRALVRGRRPLEEVVAATRFPNLSVLPSDFTYRNLDLALSDTNQPTNRLARLLEPLAGSYDAVFIDCPPSISLVSENVLHAADVILVPIIPTTLSLRTLDQLTGFVAGLDGHAPRLLAFFSMVDRRKRLHREIIERAVAERDDVAEAMIPSLSVVEQMTVRREPLELFAPRSGAAQAYRDLLEELFERSAGV